MGEPIIGGYLLTGVDYDGIIHSLSHSITSYLPINTFQAAFILYLRKVFSAVIGRGEYQFIPSDEYTEDTV